MKQYKRITTILISILTVLGLCGCALLWLIGGAFEQATKPITDLAQYDTIRASYDTVKVNHFPETITPDSELFYRPPLFQGGVQFHLTTSLPATIWQEEVDQFRALAIDITDLPTHPLFKPSHWFADSAEVEILVLEAIPAGNKTNEWNHGLIRLVVVERQSQQIVYVLERW